MLTRGKLAKHVGCNIETIRYYEKVGMLSEPDRGANGYRQYEELHIKQLQFIQRAKGLGFSSGSIKTLMEITHNIEARTRAEVKTLTDAHILEISQKIKDLQKLEKTLISLTDQCDGANKSAKHCPIINSMYEI